MEQQHMELVAWQFLLFEVDPFNALGHIRAAP